jgi:hypothetical protein
MSLDKVFKECLRLEHMTPETAKISGVDGVAGRGKHYTIIRYDKDGRKLLHLTDRVLNIFAEERESRYDVTITCPKASIGKYVTRWQFAPRGNELRYDINLKQRADLTCGTGDLILLIGMTYSPAFDVYDAV